MVYYSVSVCRFRLSFVCVARVVCSVVLFLLYVPCVLCVCVLCGVWRSTIVFLVLA